MAQALLTPSVSTLSPSTSPEEGEEDSTQKGDDTIGQISLVTVPTAVNTATGMASSSAVLVTVALEDPALQERLRVLLESTVRLLYPKSQLAGAMPAPVYPLVMSGEFPLPDSLAAAAAYHTAWLLTGESRLATAFNRAMDIYYSSLEAFVSPIVRKH